MHHHLQIKLNTGERKIPAEQQDRKSLPFLSLPAAEAGAWPWLVGRGALLQKACSPTPWALKFSPWEVSQPCEPVSIPTGAPRGTAELCTPAAGLAAAARPRSTLAGVTARGDAVPPRCSPALPTLQHPPSPQHLQPKSRPSGFPRQRRLVPVPCREPPSPCPATQRRCRHRAHQ